MAKIKRWKSVLNIWKCKYFNGYFFGRKKRQAPFMIFPEILVIVDYDGYRYILDYTMDTGNIRLYDGYRYILDYTMDTGIY